MTGTPYARYEVRTPHITNFRKHQLQPAHLRAVAGAAPDYLPCTQDFLEVLDLLRRGTFRLRNVKRSYKIAYCLYQAIKSKEIQEMKQASVVCLFRDERRTRVAVSARLVSADLSSVDVNIGVKRRESGTGAMAITQTTEELLKTACTMYDVPGRELGIRTRPEVDGDLFRHMREAIQAICVDSAADELLSCEMMRSAQLMGSEEKLTPNLLMVMRDKAHASRRLTSKPWSCDDYLRETMAKICRGSGSAARIIANSLDINNAFKAYAQEARALKNVCSQLRAAPHRFDSYAKPMGRTCVYLKPMVQTMIANAARSDLSGKAAKAWLEFLDEERCVQAAMLADAADESLLLTRIFDSEHVDTATVHREITHYLRKIKSLFGPDAKK